MLSYKVYLNEARSEKTLHDRNDRAGDRFDNSNLTKSGTRSLTFDSSRVRINGKGKPVRKVIMQDASEPRSNGAGMSDEMRKRYQDAAGRRSAQVDHEKETLDMMDAANVPKDDPLYTEQQKVIASAEASRDALQAHAKAAYHSYRDSRTPEQRLAKHLQKQAKKTGGSGKAERTQSHKQNTSANASGTGSKQARAARRVLRRENRRKFRQWSATPNEPPKSDNQQPAPQPQAATPPTSPPQTPLNVPQSPNTQNQTTATGTGNSNKPKFHLTGKQAAGAALAVTGVAAAGLAARHIYKKRQERKRKEREAAEREAKKPLNRIKKVFTQHS